MKSLLELQKALLFTLNVNSAGKRLLSRAGCSSRENGNRDRAQAREEKALKPNNLAIWEYIDTVVHLLQATPLGLNNENTYETRPTFLLELQLSSAAILLNGELDYPAPFLIPLLLLLLLLLQSIVRLHDFKEQRQLHVGSLSLTSE